MAASDSILAFSQEGHSEGPSLDQHVANERDLRAKQALTLWLRWNAAYEQTTARMFQPGANIDSLQQVMDEMDELRRQAIALSRDLL